MTPRRPLLTPEQAVIACNLWLGRFSVGLIALVVDVDEDRVRASLRLDDAGRPLVGQR